MGALLAVFLFLNQGRCQNLYNHYDDGKVKVIKGTVQQDVVVARDGSGDFIYLADAIEALRVYLPHPVTVMIRPGIYVEKVEIPATLTNVTFKGAGADQTIIRYDDYAGKAKIGTFDSYTLKVSGSSLRFEDLTIENSAGPVGQAVALHADGDRLVFENCRFIGNQDTMFAAGEGSRQYFRNCYIEGTTDFIFGGATAVFDHCIIHSKKDSFITAASTPKHVKYGYVFKNCQLTSEHEVKKVYLGRPWRPYAKTVFVNCEMGDHIVPRGWHNWGNPENEKTAFYAELNSNGPGAEQDQRVAWSVQLDGQHSTAYSLDEIFKRVEERSDGELQWYK
ncbi:pectin esterase [Echinicola soli]|uniref:Pectinesterase n=2 Tax=Echinicola soli TaxID=2591634 RepID=A0A514CNW4_9BACT|nr:pectin esterase [Echinicola soli]